MVELTKKVLAILARCAKLNVNRKRMGAEMNDYRVTYEVRKQGAIGIFENRTYAVSAEDEESARNAAFDLAHSEGLETRLPVSVEEVAG